MVGLEFNTVLMPERWSDPHLHNPGRHGPGEIRRTMFTSSSWMRPSAEPVHRLEEIMGHWNFRKDPNRCEATQQNLAFQKSEKFWDYGNCGWKGWKVLAHDKFGCRSKHLLNLNLNQDFEK